jgi:hypothetical protein
LVEAGGGGCCGWICVIMKKSMPMNLGGCGWIWVWRSGLNVWRSGVEAFGSDYFLLEVGVSNFFGLLFMLCEVKEGLRFVFGMCFVSKPKLWWCDEC